MCIVLTRKGGTTVPRRSFGGLPSPRTLFSRSMWDADLTVADVAALVGRNRETVYRWVRDGILVGYQLGGRGPYRFRREDVEALLIPSNASDPVVAGPDGEVRDVGVANSRRV